MGRDQPTPYLCPTKTNTTTPTLQLYTNTTTASDQDQPDTTPNQNQCHHENTAAMHQHHYSWRLRPQQHHTNSVPKQLRQLNCARADQPPQLTKTNPRSTLNRAHPPAPTVPQQHRQRATRKPKLNKYLLLT